MNWFEILAASQSEKVVAHLDDILDQVAKAVLNSPSRPKLVWITPPDSHKFLEVQGVVTAAIKRAAVRHQFSVIDSSKMIQYELGKSGDDGVNLSAASAKQLSEKVEVHLRRITTLSEIAGTSSTVERSGFPRLSEIPDEKTLRKLVLDDAQAEVKRIEAAMAAQGIPVRRNAGNVSAPTLVDSTANNLVDADARLNQLYKGLQSALSSEKMSSLRNEQRQWIKDRDMAVKSAVSSAGVSPASREGKNLADQILLRWTLQRCEILEALSK